MCHKSPPKRRISVLIYAKMPPFFHAERTHGWIKKKSDSATCRIAEDLPDTKHLLLFFPVGGRTLRSIDRNFLRQSSDNRHVDDFRRKQSELKSVGKRLHAVCLHALPEHSHLESLPHPTSAVIQAAMKKYFFGNHVDFSKELHS